MKIKSDNPKVIFVIHSFNINGVLTQSLILSGYFKNRGYDVLVIGNKGKYGDKLFKKCGIKTLFKNNSTLNEIQHLDFVTNVKLIICESIFSYDMFLGISKLLPKAFKVLRVHEEVNEELLKKNLWQYKTESDIQEIFNQFALTIFPSNHTADFYSKKIGNNKFSVILITLNEDIKKVTCKNDQVFRVLQLGTVYQRKNPIFTLIAFEKFLLKYNPPKAELIFVGARGANKSEIDYIMRLKTEIRIRKLDSKVKIVRTTLLPEKYICKASLITLHSYSECTPTVYLEANYLGKYVVASEVGGVNEVVKNNINGYLFDYGDIDEQANLFGKVYEKDSLSIFNQSLQDYYYENFSNKIFFKKIEDTFKKILYEGC